MRTATPETVRELRRAIGQTPYSRWAKEHGLLPVTVRAALKRAPMSATRENVIRASLDLPPIRFEVVHIMPDEQRIVTRTRPRVNVRRAMTMRPQLARRLDEIARANGYSSAGAMALAELTQKYELHSV